MSDTNRTESQLSSSQAQASNKSLTTPAEASNRSLTQQGRPSSSIEATKPPSQAQACSSSEVTKKGGSASQPLACCCSADPFGVTYPPKAPVCRSSSAACQNTTPSRQISFSNEAYRYRGSTSQSQGCTSNELYVNMISSMLNFTSAANDFMQSSGVQTQKPECHRQLETILSNLNTQLNELCPCSKDISADTIKSGAPKGRLRVYPKSLESKERDRYTCPHGASCDAKDCRRCRGEKKSRLPVTKQSSSRTSELDKTVKSKSGSRSSDSGKQSNSGESDTPQGKKSESGRLETIREGDSKPEAAENENEKAAENEEVKTAENNAENEGGEAEGNEAENTIVGEDKEDDEEGGTADEGGKGDKETEEPGAEKEGADEKGDEETASDEFDDLSSITVSTDEDTCRCAKLRDECLCDEQEMCKCDASVECEVPDSAIKKLMLLRELKKKLSEAEKNLLDLQREISCLGRAMSNQAEVCKQPSYPAAIYKQIMKTTTSIDEITNAASNQPYVKKVLTTEEYRRIPSSVPTRVVNTATPPRNYPQASRTCPGLLATSQQYRERPPPTIYAGAGMQRIGSFQAFQPCLNYGSQRENTVMPYSSTRRQNSLSPIYSRPQSTMLEETTTGEEIEDGFLDTKRSRSPSGSSYCDKCCRR